ncbi:MAG TPA: 4'-phosphopantetheinyl transferase superfamily protein [Acidothermaceae bacterium]|jgi:4'-phosphopantetheinyl transferase
MDSGPQEAHASDLVTVASTSTEAMSPDELAEAIQRLTAHEQRRASDIRLERPRRSFVVGRLLLRSTVARIAGVRPEEVVIEVEPSGRPVLTGALSRYFVSIAHSGAHVVVAVANEQIGVDVEELRQSAPSPQLMARVCSPDELRLLEHMNEDDRAAGFMKVWTRKEAYGKAIGVGIGFGLQSVTVGVSGPTTVHGSGDWQVADIDIDAACAAAVVASGPYWRVQLDRADRRNL